MKLKMLALAIGLIVSQEAPAGFLTGAIVGSMLSSDGSKNQQNPAVTIASEANDVITCVQTQSGTLVSLCVVKQTSANYDTNLQCFCVTPEEYARRAGYSKLLKVGTQFYDRQVYLLLEVLK